LIRMESRTSVLSSRRRKLVFTYDYLGRRVKKAVYTWNTSTSAYNTSPSGGSKFVYDGWNLIAELGVSNTTLVRSCTWGQDLSGSLQGAGGIGGLAFVRQYGTEAGSYYPAYDANGNLIAMVKASNSTLAAKYDYSPYGETLTSTGSFAATNPFKFSTKYCDVETGLYYFGYRYYNPETGRWINRDPIEEKGGANVYEYGNSNPISFFDPLGLLDIWEFHNAGLTGHWGFKVNGRTGATVDFGPKGGKLLPGTGICVWGADEPSAKSSWISLKKKNSGKLLYGRGAGKRCCVATDNEIVDCIYDNCRNWTGSWYLPIGQNCRSFVVSTKGGCCLE
jgi:RHS repeat-associated protein